MSKIVLYKLSKTIQINLKIVVVQVDEHYNC